MSSPLRLTLAVWLLIGAALSWAVINVPDERGRDLQAVAAGVPPPSTIVVPILTAPDRETVVDEASNASPTTVVDAEPLIRPSTTQATTTTTRPLRSFSMAFTGDFLLHTRVNVAAANAADHLPGRDYDYRPLLQAIEPTISSVDWAVCHMETPLSADGTRLHPYPVFRVPGRIAFDAADIGYDSCTTASNHTLDHGRAGVEETLGVIEAAGLHFVGSARSPQEATEQQFLSVNGVAVAHLAYTYGFNGFRLPSDAQWMSNLIERDRILNDAAAARAAGAEYVMVSLHWGEQYWNQPNRQQQELGPVLLASDDIDLIVGHHAHVVQPIDRIDGEWLVYGLGNLLANAFSDNQRDQLMVEITVREDADAGFSTDLTAHALYNDTDTLTVHRSNPEYRQPDGAERLNRRLEASWERVSEVLQSGSGWNDLELQ